MPKKFVYLTIAMLAVLPMAAIAAADPADVAAVVTAVKAANPDLKSLCQQGPDSIRKAVTDAIMSLMAAGKLKGNPQTIGEEAGPAIGRECAG
jgi:hypothetical protein